MKHFKGVLWKLGNDEVGSVESALVIIPTMILFLSVLQIASTALLHGYALNNLQGTLSRVALLGDQNQNILPSGSTDISSSTGSSDSSLSTTINGHDIEVVRTPLVGGGYLITGITNTRVPLLSPLFPNGDEFQSKTLVVDENQ